MIIRVIEWFIDSLSSTGIAFRCVAPKLVALSDEVKLDNHIIHITDLHYHVYIDLCTGSNASTTAHAHEWCERSAEALSKCCVWLRQCGCVVRTTER